ncbi:MAG: hypothetical protein K9H25_09385 [Rhodospirillum sp.]|nr:hypothetical protein [Rhodospirillum sp.]MCF8490708.1 hypothetical protein [Rhodospirillum sp.]MCF8499393.1 hypothetical protein [Rhodospirillum sp.]
MTAPDPKRILDSRLLQALDDGVFLGDGQSADSLSEWMVLCGDIPDSTILCDLPVLLGRLSRDDQRTGALRALGLLPETGSRPLFYQAVAARISSRARALTDAARDSGHPSPALLPARIAQEAREAQEVRHQMNTLADAALAVEAERERLEREYAGLADTLKTLEMDVAEGIRTFAKDRSASPRALADLAESLGLTEEAKLLRTQPPRPPFALPIPNRLDRSGESATPLRVTIPSRADQTGSATPTRH